jgi:hypothetical protein
MDWPEGFTTSTGRSRVHAVRNYPTIAAPELPYHLMLMARAGTPVMQFPWYLAASSSRVQLFGALFFELFRNCPRKLLSFGDVLLKSKIHPQGDVGSTDRMLKSSSFSRAFERDLT